MKNEPISNCCGAGILEPDICAECLEHCEAEETLEGFICAKCKKLTYGTCVICGNSKDNNKNGFPSIS